VVGRPTLTRAVGRLVASSPADVVGTHGWWPDPASTAGRVLPGVPAAVTDPPLPLEPVAASLVGTVRDALAPTGGPRDPAWLTAWVGAGRTARRAASKVLVDALDSEEVDHALPSVPEPFVAARTLAAVPEGGLLVVGSSKPIRDLALQTPRTGVRVLANRGVAGIDGTISTAVGAALAHQVAGGGAAYALLGDLTFLHDGNGLVLGPDEPRPDLTVVVVNNDGGAIFGTLEQGAPELAAAYERVFGTPHGVDLAALCAATGTPFVRPGTVEELDAALVPAAGLRVVEVVTDRAAAVTLAARMQTAVQEALALEG
jgi:2-succinyl-5-enolpyruvyl-6-hydroxy-3-cyclohexene-1-carboxylate synthase